MIAVPTITQEICDRLGPAAAPQQAVDHIPTLWVAKDRVFGLLRFLKEDVDRPYKACRWVFLRSVVDGRWRLTRR